MCVHVCVCVCVCVWTRKREGDWGWKDDHVWTQPRVAGIAHGSPVFWRSWPGRPWKMAEPLGIIWETWWVCIGARNPWSRIPGESQLLLCDTKWLDLKLYWCFSSFNLLRFLLKLVGEGPEGFGGKRKHFREGNAKRGGLLGGKTFIILANIQEGNSNLPHPKVFAFAVFSGSNAHFLGLCIPVSSLTSGICLKVPF